MPVRRFGTRTPAKRMPHAHARNENSSGNLAFLNQHRGGAVDCDVQPSKGPLPGNPFFKSAPFTQWTEHWPKPRRMGYRYIVVAGTKRTRRLSRAELNRPINRWNSSAFHRLREGKSVNSRGPKTLDQYVAHAKQANCQPLFEFKNANNVARPRVAASIVAICQHYDVALMPMVLADRRNVTGMIRTLSKHKIVTAVIGGKKAQKLKNRFYVRTRATALRPWIVRW